jgi:hypothetical protein
MMASKDEHDVCPMGDRKSSREFEVRGCRLA